MVEITHWLRRGQVKGARIGRRGDICMPLHCERGGGRRVKSDSTVSNSFPCRADQARLERPGWQMTPNICVMQPLQMRDFTSQPLPFLSVYGTLPFSSHHPWLSGTGRRMTDLPWKLPWNGLQQSSCSKLKIFLPRKYPANKKKKLWLWNGLKLGTEI